MLARAAAGDGRRPAYLKGAGRAALARLDAEVARLRGAARPAPRGWSPTACSRPRCCSTSMARTSAPGPSSPRDEGAEMMLRPDFTVPIVRLHMEAGARPRALCLLRAGLAAAGMRARPAAGIPAGRASRSSTAATRPRADAEVLALVAGGARRCAGRAVTGDLGLILAAIDALRHHATRARRRCGGMSGGRRGSTRCWSATAGGTPRCAGAGGADRRGARGPAPRWSRRRRAWACATRAEVAARLARLARGGGDAAARRGRGGRHRGGAGGGGTAPAALAALRGLARGLPALAPGGRTRFAAPARGVRGARDRRRRRCASRRASGGRRWNITTASCSARCRAGGPTCRRSPAAGATTR